MLSKNNRLAKDSEIKTALKLGRGFFNPFFSLKFLRQAQGKRFAVVVSTKVFKSAVRRNRLKRIVREYLRKNLDKFKTGSYIIIARPKINRLPEKEILPAFLDACSKLK